MELGVTRLKGIIISMACLSIYRFFRLMWGCLKSL
jgi:hypothetical protein